MTPFTAESFRPSWVAGRYVSVTSRGDVKAVAVESRKGEIERAEQPTGEEEAGGAGGEAVQRRRMEDVAFT